MSPDAVRALLDPAAIARVAARLPLLRGRDILGARLAAFWVKPGRHFNACFELEVDGGRLLVSGFALDAPRADALCARLGRHLCREGALAACPRCATVRTEEDLVLQAFPFDDRMRTLPRCLDGARIGQVLGGDSAVVECEPQGYRPGMRCQIRYRFADGSLAFGKVAVEREPGRAFRVQQQLFAALDTAAGSLRVARPWRYVADLRLTVVHGVRGESLHDLLSPDRPPVAALANVAQGLGELHRLVIDGVDRVYTPAEEVALVHSWVEMIGELFPPHREPLRACLERLREMEPRPAAQPILVHRDFYGKQVLLTSPGMVFLDLDTVCRGDPEIDLGNFCAHLTLRALQGQSPAWAAPAERLFLSAYAGSVLRERFEWYRRMTLLRLACVYALRPQWRGLVPELIAAAAETGRDSDQSADGVGRRSTSSGG